MLNRLLFAIVYDESRTQAEETISRDCPLQFPNHNLPQWVTNAQIFTIVLAMMRNSSNDSISCHSRTVMLLPVALTLLIAELFFKVEDIKVRSTQQN